MPQIYTNGWSTVFLSRAEDGAVSLTIQEYRTTARVTMTPKTLKALIKALKAERRLAKLLSTTGERHGI